MTNYRPTIALETSPRSLGRFRFVGNQPRATNRGFMPFRSSAQRRAMYAAASGYSNLGIPKSVAEEFIRADAAEGGVEPTDGDLNDYETAEAIRAGELPSPTKHGNSWLFDLRVTATGMAFRESLGEWAYRNPEDWASEDFVKRCNGLAVIWEHPEKTLDTEEFRERSIGAVVLPYLKGDEVWGIAKIFDEDAALAMQKTHCSTSPCVTPAKGAKAMTLESGHQVLDEGLPVNLEHLAVCEVGVWDKGGPPEGIRLDSALIGKGEVVTDEEKAALEKERDDARKERDDAKAKHDSEKSRADAAEKERDDAKKRHDEAEEKRKEDAKRDSMKMDAKRKDSRKKHHDSKKHDGEFMDCSRCDSESEEIEKEEKAEEEAEKADKAKKDAAKEAEPDAGKGTEIHDSAKIKQMEQHIAELQRANRPLTIEERDELSQSFHKYNGLCQMLMDASPQPIPGETPIAFRKRAANQLRKYTTSFQNYQFHDSQQLRDFELVENAIFAEATAYAKNPPAGQNAGQVREIKDSVTLPGKVITSFTGDQHAIWAPFQSPVRRFLKKVITQPRHAAY